jgi:uncharacterized protein YdeI (YjbR/CyaY-like superfamily)
VKVDPKSVRAFESSPAFEAWLAKHHDREREIFLRIYKKGSGTPTVTNEEAIDAALCWGWIDAIRKAYDESSFLQRFTPRGAKSRWSEINRDRVERLTRAGRMTPHGQRHVDAAKADGRWEAAYAPPSRVEIPPDLMRAIEAEPRALATFRTLNRQNIFALAYRTHHLKTPEGRARRIRAFVDQLKRGEAPHPNPVSKRDSAKKSATEKAPKTPTKVAKKAGKVAAKKATKTVAKKSRVAARKS